MPAPINPFKAALREGRFQLGLWVALGSAYAAGADARSPQPITGARIAEGLSRMTPAPGVTAPAFSLGFEDFLRAREAMSNGTVVNVKGASGELDFDTNGEASSEYELWKVANGAFQFVQLITPPAD